MAKSVGAAAVAWHFMKGMSVEQVERTLAIHQHLTIGKFNDLTHLICL